MANMRLSILLIALLVGCGPNAPEANQEQGQPRAITVLAGRLENRDIDEASGLARSQTNADVFWVINDSGKPRLHPIDTRGRALGRVKLDDASNSDWEDLSSFRLDGKPYLLVADIGDNDSKRKDVRLYFLAEPKPDEEEADIAWDFEFSYPGGPQDAEAIAVDVENERVLVLSKREIPAVLYALPLRPDGNKRQKAERLGVPALPQPRRQDVDFAPKTKNYWWQPTGMDLADDGSAAVILTYGGVFYYPRSTSEDWMDALRRRPVALSTGDYGEAEAIAFNADSTSIYVTLEGRGAPVIRIDLPEVKER
jgi:hypothetical protein